MQAADDRHGGEIKAISAMKPRCQSGAS